MKSLLLSFVVFGLGCASVHPATSSPRGFDHVSYGEYFILPAPMFQEEGKPFLVLIQSAGPFILVSGEDPAVIAGEEKGEYTIFRSEKLPSSIEVRVEKQSNAPYVALSVMGGKCTLLYPAMPTETYLAGAGVAGRVYQTALGLFPVIAEGDDKCHEEQRALAEKWWEIIRRQQPAQGDSI